MKSKASLEIPVPSIPPKPKTILIFQEKSRNEEEKFRYLSDCLK
jgi:hypothetical protein